MRGDKTGPGAGLGIALALGVVVLLLGGCIPLPPALAGQSAGASGHPARFLRPGRPVWIRIPVIGLNMPVVPVGRDVTGAMYTPQGPESSPIWHEGFWYQDGYLVGEPGNAVIAGHVDDPAGNLTAFSRISQLEPGDAIVVRTDRGDTLSFVVTRVTAVPNPVGGPSDPTVNAIFGPAHTPNLNLLTCTGTWVGNEFDRRLVVYSTLGS
jgi:hypothetical protein